MIVSKFGGASTATILAINNVQSLNSTERTVWVFSAIGKSNKQDKKLTDLLIAYTKTNSNKKLIKQKIIIKLSSLCKAVHSQFNAQEYVDNICEQFNNTKNKAYFVSRGEYITSKIMAEYLKLTFVPAEKLIFLNNGKINFAKTEKSLKKYILRYKNIVVPGFYALNEKLQTQVQSIQNNKSSSNATLPLKTNKEIKLFSRGGSDLTATIIAKCLSASTYENWSDVDGIFPINPKLCKSTILDALSYSKLDIMTHYDTRIIQKDCAKILNGTDIKLVVKNILNLNSPGTTVLTNCNQTPPIFVCAKKQNNYEVLACFENNYILKLLLPTTDMQTVVKTIKTLKNHSLNYR